MLDEAIVRSALADAARALYLRGHNAPRDGNLSVRLADGTLLATPTGCHKGELTADSLVRVDATSGKPIGNGRASTELALHRAIYAARPDVHAIVHAHSPHSVALTVAGVAFEPPVLPEAVATLGPVAVVPYVTPTTLAIATLAAETSKNHDVFVLERHGPVCLGTDLEQATTRLETLEHVARITWLAAALGPLRRLGEADVAAIRALG